MPKQTLLMLWVALFIFCHYSNAQTPKASKGKIERIENFKSKYVQPRNIDIWLPDGYSSAKKYAVLYMHDGQMLFDSTITWNKQEWGVDEILSALIEKNTVQPTIVVGIWNTQENRRNEYFPQKPFQMLTPYQQDTLLKSQRNPSSPLFAKNEVSSDNYLKFLVKELKPYIDKNFSTFADKAHTFVAGSSMGGLISLYALCEYPHIFEAAACLSTHWIGGISTKNNPVPAILIKYLQKKLPKIRKNRLYFDYGTATLDALYPPYQKQVDELLKNNGFNAQNWITQAFEGEAHNEMAWRKRLHIPLTFLLKK